MKSIEWMKLGPALTLMALALAAVAALVANTAAVCTRLRNAPRSTTPSVRPLARAGLPTAAGSLSERVATPEEKASAATLVTTRSIARSIDQAASVGDLRAVENLSAGLSRYGKTAEPAIQEQLERSKSPRAREALWKALELVKS